MNRIEMLKEMGITPVWVPRHVQAVASGAAAAVPDARAAAPARALAPVVETAGTPAVVSAGAPAVGAAVASAVAPVSASTASRKPLVGAVPAGHAATTRSHSASAASALSKITADPERAALIARMDWPQLKQAVAGCQACTLCQSRTNTVFGTGDEQADWLIIGEAPGQEEDRLGEPFVGQAGHLLDSMLAALDLDRRAKVYIANTLKCRPPANRHPEPHEMAQCAPHLVRQIELIAPKVILLMGRFAVQSILQTDASIASLRGRVHPYQGIPAVVTYHPAYLLRSLLDKAKAWEDLLFARSVLTGPAVSVG